MDILNMLKDQVTGTLAKQASGFLGESEGAISSALGSAFPAILGGMIDKGTSQKGAEGIMGMIKGLDMDMLGNIGNIFGGGASSVNGLLTSGGGILDMLLGDKLGGVADLIGKASGIGKGSSSSLLKMAAPFLMGMIGKQIKGKGPGALIDLLMGQKDHVARAMPAGMGSLLGLSGLGDMGNVIKGAASATTERVQATSTATTTAATNAASSGMGWLKFALPLLLLAGLAWWFLGRGGADSMKDAAASAVESTKNAASSVGNAAENAAGAVKDGAAAMADATSSAFANINAEAKKALDKVTFAAGSAGSQMKAYVDGGFKGDGTFKFNNVNFASGSASLTADSGKEIDNLAAILKAYPDVKVEIHGHTDSQGDAAKNKTLSQARAAAVQGRLIAQGIGASRMKSVGFGAEQPVADNGTADGRAKNRRIEVKIVK